jgi:hypothetical protein
MSPEEITLGAVIDEVSLRAVSEDRSKRQQSLVELKQEWDAALLK